MDSIQFWIWLIVIVVTLIARANKKKPQQYNPEGDDSSQLPSDTNKPISFEDLLREIQASKAPAQPKQVATSTTYKPLQPATREVDYDDDLEEEIKPLEKPDYTYNDDQIYETYESAKKAAFSRASLEETMHVEDTKVTYQQFQPYDKVEHKSPATRYAKELKNPQSVKRALVLSEILNRKF